MSTPPLLTPVVLSMLGEGALSLATVRLLSAHLTAENHRELLAAASGKSKRMENVRRLCRAHNAYQSEVFYGRGRPAEGGTRPGTSWVPPP